MSEVNLQGEPDALQVLCGWPRLERERGCLFVVNSVVMELLKCTLMVEMKSRHSRHNMLTGLPYDTHRKDLKKLKCYVKAEYSSNCHYCCGCSVFPVDSNQALLLLLILCVYASVFLHCCVNLLNCVKCFESVYFQNMHCNTMSQITQRITHNP